MQLYATSVAVPKDPAKETVAEARKRKKAEKEALAQEQAKAAADAAIAEAQTAKKAAQALARAEKRKLKKMQQAAPTPPPSEDVEMTPAEPAPAPEPVVAAVEPPVQKPRKKRKTQMEKTIEAALNDDPPDWFVKVIQAGKSEQVASSGEKKAKKIIKAEAEDTARTHWTNDETRGRVANEVDSHMDRLYKLVFPRK